MGTSSWHGWAGPDTYEDSMIVAAHKSISVITGQTICTHTLDYRSIKTSHVNVIFGDGYWATPSLLGVVITGGSMLPLGTKLWDGYQLKNIESMEHGHINHWAITAQDYLYVISGQTAVCEKMDVRDFTWTNAASVTIAREYATCTYLSGKLYCVGGVDVNGEPLNSIEEYDGTWRLCQFQFEFPLQWAGSVAVNENTFLILGGYIGGTNNLKPNYNAYSINIENKNVEFFKETKITGNFSPFQFAWSGEKAAMFSLSGDLTHFNSHTLNFRQDNFHPSRVRASLNLV